MNIYEFEVKKITGELITLKEFENNVLLIVNVASKCGFTNQYKDLQELYKKYNDKGFEVLGFPCNQFKDQEPADEAEIMAFCSNTYNVTFPMFSKIDVNGQNEHPLYNFLKKSQKGLFGDNIKWNFTKFLVDRKGNPVSRHAPTVEPLSLEEDIKKLLT